jgi:hypothetical protein
MLLRFIAALKNDGNEWSELRECVTRVKYVGL